MAVAVGVSGVRDGREMTAHVETNSVCHAMDLVDAKAVENELSNTQHLLGARLNGTMSLTETWTRVDGRRRVDSHVRCSHAAEYVCL